MLVLELLEELEELDELDEFEEFEEFDEPDEFGLFDKLGLLESVGVSDSIDIELLSVDSLSLDRAESEPLPSFLLSAQDKRAVDVIINANKSAIIFIFEAFIFFPYKAIPSKSRVLQSLYKLEVTTLGFLRSA